MRTGYNPLVYAVHVPEQIEADLFKQGLGRISAERRLKISKFHFQMDKNRSLLAELLVRKVLRDVFVIPELEICFRTGSHGKPYLTKSGPFFNVSHAGEWVAAIFHSHEAGIDIEQLRSIDTRIASRFFNPRESAALADLEEHNRLRQFYRLWTMKEAYIKASGKGLSTPLDSFTFQPEGDEVYRYRVYEKDSQTEGRIQLIEWIEPYTCAVCVITPFQRIEPIILQTYNLWE